jgi:hypothetical protein
MSATETIRPKDRDAVVQSLRAGVVPRTGQRHIQVGRASEVQTLLGDIDRLADGGGTCRFVIGDYGAGKTFFLNLVRAMAMERKLVTANADLNPERRLNGSNGQAKSLYAELMRSLSTRTKPDGGAMAGIVEKFISTARDEAKENGKTPEAVIREKLNVLNEMVGGYDFADVIAAYWRGVETDNEQLKSDAVRWLRGEFATKTDARKALGVRTIVEDDTIYDHLKLFARFVRLAGFGGFMIFLDEMVNLHKLSNTQARTTNYEQILRIFNDSLQGAAVGLGFIMGGTPDFLMDSRRGLYSYPALQSRLAENEFAKNGLVDFQGPVIRLASLTPEDFYVLLQKVRDVFAYGDPAKHLIPDSAIEPFMAHCSKKIGSTYFRTPRTTIRAFAQMLAVLEQNPGQDWRKLIDATAVEKDDGGAAERAANDEDDDDDKLASFKL